MLTHSQRAELCTNPTAKKLFTIMAEKKTNLSLSVDVTAARELIKLANEVGPEICMLKTHIDVVEDFTPQLAKELVKLANEHNFVIFEDRKFADIGNTVKMQYEKGIYHIAEWAAITNAHIICPGTIQALKETGLTLGNGLLLLAELSAKNLITPEYTAQAVKLAKENEDFVIGFITQHKLIDDPKFIHATPGVHLAAKGDSLGQQYISPHDAIVKNGNDIIIVGRGIYGATEPKAAAKEYRKQGWECVQ